jgi:hypothetical protein
LAAALLPAAGGVVLPPTGPLCCGSYVHVPEKSGRAWPLMTAVLNNTAHAMDQIFFM